MATGARRPPNHLSVIQPQVTAPNAPANGKTSDDPGASSGSRGSDGQSGSSGMKGSDGVNGPVQLQVQ